MSIRMIGIEAGHVPLEQREQFAFGTNACLEALARLHERYPACGFVLLSTCNRTELWLSDEGCRGDRPLSPVAQAFRSPLERATGDGRHYSPSIHAVCCLPYAVPLTIRNRA